MSKLYNVYHSIIDSHLSIPKRISTMTELYNIYLSFRLDKRMPYYLIESCVCSAFIDFYRSAGYLLETCNKRDLNMLSRILIGISHYYLPNGNFSVFNSDLEMLENIGAQMEFESQEFNIAFEFVKKVLQS